MKAIVFLLMVMSPVAPPKYIGIPPFTTKAQCDAVIVSYMQRYNRDKQALKGGKWFQCIPYQTN